MTTCPMRSRGPYEVKPRQLRALVLLLMLLPLIPTAFVARFMVEAVDSQRAEARELDRPIYQKFMDTAGATLASNEERQFADSTTEQALANGAADAAVGVAADGHLTPLPPGTPLSPIARSVLDSGARATSLPNRRIVRWRFFVEAPDPIFALVPVGDRPPAVLLKTRSHLLDAIRTFYARTLDPQSVLVLLDENGESIPLSRNEAAPAGDPLAECALKAPLPLWRVQLFTPGASLIGAASREQFAFYFWTIGGMLALTAAIAALAGLALTRRIVLRELSNDALAVAAHEMKTPLASVRLLVETLLERRYAGGPAQADEYLRLIATETQRLERVVAGFAMLSRLERNHGRLVAPGIVDASEIVDAACAQLHGRLEHADFAAEVPGDLPEFPGDADALTAVLVNLLDNALKYSGERPCIRLRARLEGGRLVFEVSDRGPGIARAEQEKVFERFYQVDQKLTRTHEGLGLGLSIVRSIAHAHGGEVTLVSSPGHGSTFAVWLPLQSTRQ